MLKSKEKIKKVFRREKSEKSLLVIPTSSNNSSNTYIATPTNYSPAHSRQTSTSSISTTKSTIFTNNTDNFRTFSSGEMIVTGGILSTIENSYCNYLPIIEAINGLCEKIVKSYDTIRENKRICRVLIDKAEIAHISVKQLVRTKEENEENFRSETYFRAFIRLQKALENIESFIKKISNYGAFKNFMNVEHVRKCFDSHVEELDKVCGDLGFNRVFNVHHDWKESNEKNSKMWESVNESFKNAGGEEAKQQAVWIGSLNKSMKSNDFEHNEAFSKTPDIDPNEIEDVKPQYKKATDVRGKDHNVVKKVFKKTVDVACKYIVGDLDAESSEAKKFNAQLVILNAIQCEYIVKFYGISNVNARNVLIFGWAEKGNLKELYETHYIDWITKLKIAYDIIRGLIFMHRCKILHRDVRCENILIDENGNPKISNFHLSRELSQPSKKVERVEDYLPWLAPEKIPTEKVKPDSRRYDFHCEMYSFGMLLWELAYQQIPYKGKTSDKIKDHVLSGQRETIKIGIYNEEIQSNLIRIIIRAWEAVPHDRPTFDEIMDTLTRLSKKHGSCNYSARFLAKNEISVDNLHTYNIEMPSDFKIVEFKRTVFEPLIPLEEGRRAYKEYQDFKKAWKCFCDNAELKDFEAIYWKAYFLEAGKANESGKPTTEDLEEATKLHKIAADNGIADAQTQYAFLIYKKDKVNNLEEFKKYLQLAAKNENGIALLNLGNFYLKGTHGYDQNIDLAKRYLQSAAFQCHNEEISRRAMELINDIERANGGEKSAAESKPK